MEEQREREREERKISRSEPPVTEGVLQGPDSDVSE
jgi:hypothetical protein